MDSVKMKAGLVELQHGAGWPQSRDLRSWDIHGTVYTYLLAPAEDISCLLRHPVTAGITNSYQWACRCITVKDRVWGK